MNENILRAASFAMKNKDKIINLESVGCFHCLKTFPPKEIKLWADGGETAVCPYCEVDTVVNCSDEQSLKEMNQYWLKSKKL